MICPDCNGKGEAIYYIYLGADFAENTVNIKPKKDICRTCNGSGHMTQTNADRIRTMSDGELAQMLNKAIVCHTLRELGYCHKCSLFGANPCDTEGLLEWLKQPAEG